ncbi:thiamine-phosphate synthase family protein [Thermococcus sp.]|uniref:thiamine-phosphate synthase family protein n=1 Tax=Thermococcus sp. TaxID=35749 RepID=UPI0026134F9C|nr:thiamine-phosphate synthase family protein [Thermococcus sp.]
MKTPSVYITEELMPYLRARIAGILYREGLRQSRIAGYLGITQAMVSKYLGGMYKRPPEEVAVLLDAIAEEIAGLILTGAAKDEIIVFTSRRLFELFSSGKLCRHYAKYAGVSEDICRSLFAPTHSSAVEEMRLALRELLSLPGLPKLIPEVRSNLAYAPPGAKSPADVIAIPGRITLVKGRPYALPPEPGASKFTASLILSVSGRAPEVRSVMNVRLDHEIAEAVGKLGLKYSEIRTGGLSDEEAIERIAGLFENDSPDFILDWGGEGVEPLTYVFGRNPLDVVGKVKVLLEVMK